MRLLRRLIHIVAWAGTLVVGLVALALIVSQTPWFRDWIRRTLIRESRQYLDGELTIGRVSGNLFYDFALADVAVDVSGDRVIAVKSIGVDYSIFQLIFRGIVVDHITLTEPRLHAVRDERGWNLGRLARQRAQEADRRGPGRSVSLPSIAIVDGSLTVDDRTTTPAYRIPRRIEDFDVQAAFRYEPVHYTIDIGNLRFRGTDPDLTLTRMAGGIAVRDDNLYLEKVTIATGESAINVSGVLESYLRTPILKLVADGTVSMPEVGRVVPVLSGYELHPKVAVKTNGPASRLVMDLDIRSEAGTLRGPLTADLASPDLAFAGSLGIERLNLGPILKAPAQKSDITGAVRIDLTLPSNPPGVPAFDRLGGAFAFNGSRVIAFGYDAAGVTARGTFTGPRITLAGASARAYGASATASGTIVLPHGRRPFAFDLKGTAADVDLRRLPPATRAPKLETVLTLTDYHVAGSGTAVRGSATLDRSTVEGATLASGTVVEFDAAATPMAYGAQGALDGLDVRRLGQALEIDALTDPRYQGTVNGSFDLRASGTALKDLTLDANGTLTDTTMWGMHVPSMAFDTSIAGGGLAVTARGPFDRMNPAVISGQPSMAGNVSGAVDATVRIADLSAPLTMAAIDVDGRITLEPSLIGSVQIAGASVEGRYADETADLARVHVDGPDVTLDASGRLALGRTSTSDFRYRVNASDITELGRVAGQDNLDGAVVLDGTITGNAESLAARGTVSGNGLAYGAHKALDVDSRYLVAVPNFDVVNARVEATSVASFVEIAGVGIDQIDATTTYDRKRLAFDATVQERGRSLTAAGDVIFHPDHQELHLPKLVITTEGIEWQNVPGTEAAIQYRQGSIGIEGFRLARGDQSIEVAGTIARGGAAVDGALTVRAVNVELAEVERLLLQERGLVGRLTADARLTGSLEAPAVDGHVQITGGGFQGYRYDALTADVDYSGQRIELDATLQQSPTVAITAKGRVPTSVFERGPDGHVAATPADTIDLRIHTPSLDLGIVQGFTTAVSQVGGTLEADVRLTGSGRDPHVGGYVEIRNGAFSVPQFGTSYSGLDTRIDLEPDLVRVRRFEILDENGEQLAVQGQLAVHQRQVGAVDFTLESQNFEIIDNELGDVGVGTNLKVTGSLARPTVVGDVRVTAGRLELDRILRLFYDPYSVQALPEVVSAERTVETAGGAQQATEAALARASQGAAAATPAAGPATAGAAPPARGFDPVALDIRVRIPDNLVVRGRKLRPGGPTRASVGNLNVTFGGNLDVRKAAGGPVALSGTINTVRGTYQFQGRQFDIARNGTIRFTGEPELNPVLDVTATRQIPDTGIEARVRVTGSLKKPELALSSTPPLEESDVLALIVFNRPINELGTGERASLAATAGGIATGFIATPLGESIGRALDLDIFEITPTSEGDTLGAGITIGEQVGERTFLKLRQQFGDQTYSEFLLEYQIADFLRLAGSLAPETSNAGNRIGQRRIERAGMDLIFFFSY
jgi:translocation and assembly module TamB